MDQSPNSAPPQQPPTPPAPSAPESQAVVTGKKSNKMPLIIGIIIAAVIAVGGIAYGVYAYITNTPDYMLSKATDQIVNSANNANAMAATFKLTSGTDSTGVNVSGDIAVQSDPANKNNSEVIVGVGSGSSRVVLSAMAVDSSLYIRGTSLANLGNLIGTFDSASATTYNSAEFKSAMQNLENVWFSLSKSDLQDFAPATGSTAVTDTPTPQDIKRVMDIYNKHHIFKADKTFADETIAGVSTAHFNLKVDANELSAFLTDLKNANIKSITVTDQDIKDAQTDATNFSKDTAVDVWISRSTQQFKQIKIASLQKGSEGALTVTLSGQLPKFDKIEKPANAKPFSELFTTLLGPAASLMQQSSSFDSSTFDQSLMQ